MSTSGETQRRLWADPATRQRMLGGQRDTWPPEKLAELLRLHALGSYSLSEMGDLLGFSRGAIQGKLARLGLKSNRPANLPKRPKTTRVLKFRQARKPKERKMAVTDLPLSPTAKCQFIEGEPSGDDSCKCGKPAIVDRPYCPEHHARCYIPLPLKVRAEAA